MIHALWFFGIVALSLFAVAIFFALQGSEPNSRALAELIATLPAFAGVGVLVIWLILAAIHWS